VTRPIVRPNADRTDWRYYHPACGRISGHYGEQYRASAGAASHDCARPRPDERVVRLSRHSRFHEGTTS
jgi:hypothetical protein